MGSKFNKLKSKLSKKSDDVAFSTPVSIDNDDDGEMEKGAVRAGKGLFGGGSGNAKRGYGGGSKVTLDSVGIKRAPTGIRTGAVGKSEEDDGDMEKGGPGSGKKGGSDSAGSGGKISGNTNRYGEDGKTDWQRSQDKIHAENKKAPVTEHGKDSDLVAEYNKKMAKGGPGSGQKGHKTNTEGGAFLREDKSKDEDKKDKASNLADIYAKYGMSGADIAFMTDVAGIKDYEVNKSYIDEEIEGIAKAMEFSTIDPSEGIKKAIFELGPEGLKKALPNMSDENKTLLGEFICEMKKSHKLPLTPPKKLVNVGGENYVEEQVGNDMADEAIFEESVLEGDNEQKHQGGAHDMQPKDWQGQIIKSILELEDHEEVLEGLETIYDAWEMKKAKKMEMKKECMDDMDGDMDLEKMKMKKMMKKNMYKGEDSVAEDVAEIKGPKKVNEVLDDAPNDKKDDILRELRESKMKKAKDMMKNMMKKEMEDKDEDMDMMKKKMRKAFMEVISEEYTDEEIEKAMKKGEEEGEMEGEKKEVVVVEEKPKVEEKKEVVIAKPEGEESMEMEKMKKMKKARELFTAATQHSNPTMAGLLLTKAKEMMDSAKDIPEASQVKPGVELMLNEGKAKGKVEAGLESKTKADDVKVSMKKSVRYYGEPNDAFKAGRLGRHSYASSVNEYYDAALYKAENKEETLKKAEKSVDYNNINDLIENGLFKSAVDLENDRRLGEFKKSKGSFGNTSFSEDDMIDTCHISKEDLNKI